MADIPPIIQGAVVLDVAATKSVDCLAPAQEIAVAAIETAPALSGAMIRPGDAVLIRTGDPTPGRTPKCSFGRRGGMPGPGETATRWLIERGARLMGSDTPGFERLPTPDVSVHAILLVDAGIHIIEIPILRKSPKGVLRACCSWRCRCV